MSDEIESSVKNLGNYLRVPETCKETSQGASKLTTAPQRVTEAMRRIEERVKVIVMNGEYDVRDLQFVENELLDVWDHQAPMAAAPIGEREGEFGKWWLDHCVSGNEAREGRLMKVAAEAAWNAALASKSSTFDPELAAKYGRITGDDYVRLLNAWKEQKVEIARLETRRAYKPSPAPEGIAAPKWTTDPMLCVAVECDLCHAEVGEKCKIDTGETCKDFHIARQFAAMRNKPGPLLALLSAKDAEGATLNTLLRNWIDRCSAEYEIRCRQVEEIAALRASTARIEEETLRKAVEAVEALRVPRDDAHSDKVRTFAIRYNNVLDAATKAIFALLPTSPEKEQTGEEG